jgi:hypothetical protein
MTLAFITFVFIKIKYTYASHPGEEHDLVFNYGRHYWVLIIEDIIGNFITFFYTTIITYLPPQLTFSNAYLLYGPETIIELQNGYDNPYTIIAAINALFFWRFYAGIFLSIFIYYFYKIIKKLIVSYQQDYLYLFIFMSMILLSSPAHMLVKYRAMHVVPWLFYQTFIGQIGIILLISYSLYMLHKSNKSKKMKWIVTLLIWLNIVSNAFIKDNFFKIGRSYGSIAVFLQKT